MEPWISYQQSPIQELKTEFEGRGVHLLVRREDINHPTVSGNKWWKLKYNLQEAQKENYDTVLTFGGAYSNHIYATAAACRELKLKSIGIIRGEEIEPLNSTITFVKSCGMQLEFISRDRYRSKTEPEFLFSLQEKFGRCYIIPEGGTNNLAVRGCEELGKNLLQTEFDFLCLPVGTGGTIAGIINAFAGERKIIGIPVLKGGNFLNNEIKKFLSKDYGNWQLMLDYHFGGYAKTNAKLDGFIAEMNEKGLPLEFVYSGKLFWGVFDLIRKGFFPPGSTVMLLHTGGIRPD